MGGDEGDDGPDLSCFNFGSDSESEGKESASSSKAGSTSSAPDLKKMLKSHRQEEQRLRTVAKEKKFSIPKTDRAARAAADEELEALLADMRKRHEAELAAAGADTSAAVADAVSGMSLGGAGNVASTGTAARKGSKAAKQRARREEAERNRDKRMQDVKDNAGPSLREEELKRLANILSPHGLRVHEIAADGHCLYRSLAHQLCANSDASSIDFQYCRKLAADYIRAHPDDFLPYLLADHDFTEGLIESYCNQVESSNEWGGQLEITAIAHALRRTIVVYSADAPEVLTGLEYEANGPRLRLAYHRHYFGLGEHYNSLVMDHA